MTWENMEHSTYTNLDCKIHYWRKMGKGNKVALFLHGAGVDHKMFEHQIELFDDSYTLVFWDARGHGLSKLEKSKKITFGDMFG